MRNLNTLISDSMSLGNYKSTYNLNFLSPLIERELNKHDNCNNATKNNMVKGLLEANLSMLNDAKEDMKEGYEILHERIKDPILNTISQDIFNALDWITVTSDDEYKKLGNIALFFSNNNQIVNALLFAYESLINFADRLGLIFLSDVKSQGFDHLMNKNKAFKELVSVMQERKKFRDLNRNSGNYNKEEYLDLVSNKKIPESTNEYMRSDILYFLFQSGWSTLQLERNGICHPNNKHNIEGAMAFIRKTMPTLKDFNIKKDFFYEILTKIHKNNKSSF